MVSVMVFNATFNNISDISSRSVVLMEKNADLSEATDRLYHIMLYRVHSIASHGHITIQVYLKLYC